LAKTTAEIKAKIGSFRYNRYEETPIAVIISIEIHEQRHRSFSFILSIIDSNFLLFLKSDMFIFQSFLSQALKTVLVVAIAVAIAVGIVTAVFVFGGQYQQELFEEYMKDSQKSSNSRVETSPNLPKFDILP